MATRKDQHDMMPLNLGRKALIWVTVFLNICNEESTPGGLGIHLGKLFLNDLEKKEKEPTRRLHLLFRGRRRKPDRMPLAVD
jgi:hypothetical protein